MSGAGRHLLRVFVGNLPWTVGSQELRQFGSSFGPVTSSLVVFDKSTGMSKGYGFITFGNKEAYNASMMSGAGSLVLDGHRINIQATTSSNSSNE